MLSPFRLAGIITMILAVSGLSQAPAIAPAGSGVTIDRVEFESNLAHTVKYYVTGGSPQLRALVRRVEWAENELSVIEQLQLLKLDTVVNERSVAAARTAQFINPFPPPGFPLFPYRPGFAPFPVVGDAENGESFLQRSLKWQLASEATPEAAMQMIGLLEHLQIELDAALKKLPPKEQKAAQGPLDALRPRLAALPRGAAPRSQKR